MRSIVDGAGAADGVVTAGCIDPGRVRLRGIVDQSCMKLYGGHGPVTDTA